MSEAIPPAATDIGASWHVENWAIERLQVRGLWERGWRGQGVLIGHLDTGVDAAHPLLGGRLAEFRYFDRHGQPDETARPHDSGTHGTRTASLICGGEVDGVPIGVAPEVRLLSGQVIEDGDALARVLSGLDWLASRQIRICCLAMGFVHPELIFSVVMPRLQRRGMLVVAPIGNGGAGRALSPASEPSALSVGASDQSDRIVAFSGSQFAGLRCVAPGIIAPGADILAAASEPSGVTTSSGTSYAAAYVAGVAALLLQARTETSPAELIQAMAATARLPSSEQTHRCTHGLLEPLATLDFLRCLSPRPIAAGSDTGRLSAAVLDPQLLAQVEQEPGDHQVRALLVFHDAQAYSAHSAYLAYSADDFRAEVARFIAESSRAASQQPVRRLVLSELRLLLVTAPRRWLRHALAQTALSGARLVVARSRLSLVGNQAAPGDLATVH